MGLSPIPHRRRAAGASAEIAQAERRFLVPQQVDPTFGSTGRVFPGDVGHWVILPADLTGRA